MIIWNPWHGCNKISEGCEHCYMYFLDKKRGVNTSHIFRTQQFDYPIQRTKNGNYKLPSGMSLYVGLSTDFFLEEADIWRKDAWKIIRQRSDIVFRLLTKRAYRIIDCLPADWGNGYENVLLSVTCENQRRTDERLSILLDIPAKHKGFMAAPLIGAINAKKYLQSGQIEEVLCGGENYDGSRPCHYNWVKSLSEQCRQYNVTFNFIETGSVFVKNGHTYHIPNKRTQSLQAFKSGLSFKGKSIEYKLYSTENVLFDNKMIPFPFFRAHCHTCGAKMTCNGCSNCGACNKQ